MGPNGIFHDWDMMGDITNMISLFVCLKMVHNYTKMSCEHD